MTVAVSPYLASPIFYLLHLGLAVAPAPRTAELRTRKVFGPFIIDAHDPGIAKCRFGTGTVFDKNIGTVGFMPWAGARLRYCIVIKMKGLFCVGKYYNSVNS
jgi:hypothetical protein